MTLLKIIAALLVAVAFFFFILQRSMIFQTPEVSLPTSMPDYVEHLTLEEGYGLLLSPSTLVNDPAPLLIYTHGNAAAAFWHIEHMTTLREAGFYVLLLEYPGYVGAPGKPSLRSIERSALEAYDSVTARAEIDATKVIAYGRSIGGGAATLITTQRPLAALALESTFTSLSALVAEKRMPFFLLRDRFDNAKVVRELSIPVFLFHGSKDTIIPIHHSERLSELAKNHEFFQAPCGHNDCPPTWTALLEFLSNQGVL
ncbi:MAG: alpha/beta hydrolase [Gammaproteobacteria bacterium]